MNILYAENHGVFAAEVCREFLSAHTVRVVSSLAGARKAFEMDVFDLLLVDYDLDDGKGDEFVREVRCLQPGPPVIAVSAHEQGNQALVKAGANAVCGKMEFGRIQTVIDEVLSRPERPHLLYPCSPLSRSQPDELYADEYAVALERGFETSLFSF